MVFIFTIFFSRNLVYLRYKFNDDQVSLIDESDIKHQNWFGDIKNSSWSSASMYSKVIFFPFFS